MNKQNITLSLSKDIIKKAKLLAVQKDTSVSRLLSDELERIVAVEESYNNAKLRQSTILKKGYDLQLKDDISWEKGDLHDR